MNDAWDRPTATAVRRGNQFLLPTPQSIPPILALNLRKIRKGTLQDTADIEIPRWKLKIRGGMRRERNGKEWFSLPSREWIDNNGERQFAVLLEFTDKNVEARFKAAALAAMHALLAGEGAQ